MRTFEEALDLATASSELDGKKRWVWREGCRTGGWAITPWPAPKWPGFCAGGACWAGKP